MNLQWRGIGKGLPQIPMDLVLRREIQLLEELGGDRGHRDTTSGADAIDDIDSGSLGGSLIIAVVEFLLQGRGCRIFGGNWVLS